MVDVKRFDQISTEEEYKKAYDIVKSLTDFNGFFCGKCSHKIHEYLKPYPYSGSSMTFPDFCPYCGVEFNKMPNIPIQKMECTKCRIAFEKNDEVFCPFCSARLTQKIVREGGFDIEPTKSFYEKYNVKF